MVYFKEAFLYVVWYAWTLCSLLQNPGIALSSVPFSVTVPHNYYTNNELVFSMTYMFDGPARSGRAGAAGNDAGADPALSSAF